MRGVRFFKALNTKNILKKKCVVLNTQRILSVILRDSAGIPDELLLSRARFRFPESAVNLFFVFYFYNLS
jgi:hypothetical protein